MKFIVLRTSYRFDYLTPEHLINKDVQLDEHLSRKYVFQSEYEDGYRIFTIELNTVEELINFCGKQKVIIFSKEDKYIPWWINEKIIDDYPELNVIEIYDTWRE